ncbi:MAG: hypothetical protein II230_01605, partial [Clostridia bacterium]|nr:hypothetical protein [Clostridia bacterium]
MKQFTYTVSDPLGIHARPAVGSSDSGTSNTGTSIFSGKSFKTDAGNGFNVTSTFDKNGNLSMNMS